MTTLDALTVVNKISRVTDSTLPLLTAIEQFSGSYFETTGRYGDDAGESEPDRMIDPDSIELDIGRWVLRPTL